MAWDFGVDTFHSDRRLDRDSADPIDLAVNGDIDWVRLASLDPFPHISVSFEADLHAQE